MQLVPIPTTHAYLEATFPHWAPFLKDIAARSPWSVQELLAKVHALEVQPVLIFDGDKPVALIGVSIVDDDGDRVGVLVWTTGAHRQLWQHLLTDLERYLREHVLCLKCRAICRPGWKRFLEQHGYKHTGVTDDKHIIMEKVL